MSFFLLSFWIWNKHNGWQQCSLWEMVDRRQIKDGDIFYSSMCSDPGLLKDRLVQIEQNLAPLVKATDESTRHLISTVTAQCCKYISECPVQYIDHFITTWMKLFLECKDECMVLINGIPYRQYHFNQHKRYLHDRGNENKNYKGEHLSMMSVDGLDYEYKVFTRRYEKAHAVSCIACSDRNYLILTVA